VAQTVGGDEIPTASGEEGRVSSVGGTYDYVDGGASDNENSRTYNFGASTIALGPIKEMVERGYFMDGEARVPGDEAVSELDNDEVVVYEDFFVAGLRMPLHPALADILLKFQAQLHQLMPNAMAQLSKYFWAVGSFRGEPSGNAFVKRYELHYEPKKVETAEGDMFAQDGCLNFNAKRDDGPKLSLAIKNQSSSGWTKYWFYHRVLSLRSSIGGKSMYALHLRMSALDYTVELEVECPDDDANDAAFVQATATIRGRDTVEEFLACKMYPLAADFGFHGMAVGMMPMSKVQTPLPLLAIEAVSTRGADRVFVVVEIEIEIFGQHQAERI
jgi:hypothetical protein